jgi:hypothetical protein
MQRHGYSDAQWSTTAGPQGRQQPAKARARAHLERRLGAAHAFEVLEVAVRRALALARRLARWRVRSAPHELVEEHRRERALVLDRQQVCVDLEGGDLAAPAGVLCAHLQISVAQLASARRCLPVSAAPCKLGVPLRCS